MEPPRLLARKSRLTEYATAIAVVCVCVTLVFTSQAQTLDKSAAADPKSGEQIFKANCAACHGKDGKGALQHVRGFKAPETFPDFTRCDQTTPEPNTSWEAVITYGGPFRGFSQIMPSFGQALTADQIRDVARYLRTFCTNPHWPRGELNLPRALVTEKAFPESEEMISTSVNAQGAPGVESHYIHEQRFGVKNQIEIDVPITFSNEDHVWYGGVGDVTFGYKREIYSSLKKGNIFSLFGGVIAPTGSTDHGFGSGTTTFETFAAYDQLFRSNTFIQTQLGGELPVVVRDSGGQVVFESGKLRPDGSIVGNDNDDDPLRYEPHYSKIERWDQVEIYEDIMKDQAGQPTTGLLHAVGYLKDNRVLPTGFDKKTAPAEIGVVGEAAADPSFTGGEDRVQFSVWVGNAQGPFRVEAELCYQPIGFRWAHNLLRCNAMEPQRFVRYYDALSANNSVVLARAETTH
jgi:mono/diheme cytochrome c family protein